MGLFYASPPSSTVSNGYYLFIALREGMEKEMKHVKCDAESGNIVLTFLEA